jgi:hypothetical protein
VTRHPAWRSQAPCLAPGRVTGSARQGVWDRQAGCLGPESFKTSSETVRQGVRERQAGCLGAPGRVTRRARQGVRERQAGCPGAHAYFLVFKNQFSALIISVDKKCFVLLDFTCENTAYRGASWIRGTIPLIWNNWSFHYITGRVRSPAGEC